MTKNCHYSKHGDWLGHAGVVICIVLSVLATNQRAGGQQAQGQPQLKTSPSPKSALRLAELPFKIVYETYRKTEGKENWELYLINADGSNPVNLTRTSDVDEMYPHVSPNGTKICFVADEGTGRNKVRNVYYMNSDGTGRVKVTENSRQPCWSPDSRTIAYLPAEFERYTIKDFATKGLVFYDTQTGTHRQHPNDKLYHLYNICWSPDGNWFLATVHGGMGHDHANLAFEANGQRVFDLTKYGVTGCRPDCSPDGKRVTWGLTDWDLCMGTLNLNAPTPEVTDVRRVIKCTKDYEVYHTDFSPDGKYVAFSYGPKAEEMVGGEAPGWNICVTDMSGTWAQITTDGNQNKEPDWMPAPASGR